MKTTAIITKTPFTISQTNSLSKLYLVFFRSTVNQDTSGVESFPARVQQLGQIVKISDRAKIR